MADGIDHRHDAQSEGKRNSEDPDAELRHAARQQRAPAAGEHNPKCADRFGHESISHNASSKRVLLPRTMPGDARNHKPLAAPDRDLPRYSFTSHGLTSNTRLNGVCVARRNRVSPPFMTTSSSRASPAWAPRAGPLYAREAGTQIIVDAA